MAVLYLQHNAIDKAKWDALVMQSRQRQVYAMSWYLDAVAAGWEALVETDLAGDYRNVMPVPWKRKLGIRYVQQPLFCQQLGIYSSAGVVPEAIFHAFLQELYQRFRYVINLHFNVANPLPDGLSPNLPFSYTATHYLPLHKPYAQLQSAYTRDRKLNLKRACKAGLTIQESSDIEPLIQFFKQETAGQIYGGVAAVAYQQLRALYQVLQERGMARLYYTLDRQGRLNSGCLFVIWQGYIIYLFNAAPQHGRKQNGRTLIIDHVIRQYAGQEMILDFESPVEEQEAIVHFYESFGPEAMPIPVLRYNQLPTGIRQIRDVRMRLVQKLQRKSKP
ncbi:GNAT family N-acetyltransferase [Pontibacter sp. CAU 1760]